jgi:glucosamine--fructose-6-phosphate aminotransferase (isomerizing)
MQRDTHTRHEIITQPEVWRSTLESARSARPALQGFLEHTAYDHILVTGCGSTHYLSMTAASLLSHSAETSARALPASEVWLFPAVMPLDRTLLLAISRSGTTTETVRAVERCREDGCGQVLAVTCYPESTLAQMADFVLVAPDAQEESVAQTRSFTSMLLLAQVAVSVVAGDGEMVGRLGRLPEALKDLVGRLNGLPERLGTDHAIERLFFLGGGALHGIACEAMLKTKEMSLSYAEAFYPLEFRHGPVSMVDETTLVVGLLSDTGLGQELRVLQDMQGLGARVLAIADTASAFGDWRPDFAVELRSGLDERERAALYLPPLQLAALHRSLAKGLNPDAPNNLTAVVSLG